MCQEKNKLEIVQNPSYESFEKILNCIHERAEYKDKNFPTINNRIGALSGKELKEAEGKWHKNHIKRAKEHFEKKNTFMWEIC